MRKPVVIFLGAAFLVSAVKAQNAEMLNDLNLLNFNKDFSEYQQQTALFCSQVSELAYWNEKKLSSFYKEITAKYPDQSIYYCPIEHKKTHSQALIWGTKEFVVVAFRGTEPSRVKDFFTDAKFWNYETNPAYNEDYANMPPGHGGFRKSLMSIIKEEEIFKKIDSIILLCNPNADLKRFPVFLTGHSLGGALSQLFVRCLSYKGYNFSGAYHFAPALAVACSEHKMMKKEYENKVFDIVNFKDYVPRAGRNGVAHFGRFYRICDDGEIYKETESYTKFRLKEYLSEFKLHALKNHIKAIRKVENTHAQIEVRSKDDDYPCVRPNAIVPPCE